MFLKSFKIKFVLYLIPLIIFISFSFLIFFVERSTRLTEKELKNFGFALGQNLAYSCELAISSENQVFLTSFLEKTFEEKDVVMVAIYNKKGKLIIFKKKAEIEEEIPQDFFGELSRKRSTFQIESYTKDGKKIYDFYSPIFINGTSTLQSGAGVKTLGGFVRVGLSLERIVNQNRVILVVGLAITSLLIILGIGMGILLAEIITKPIRQLTKGVEIIGQGNLGYRIKLKTGDEIKALAEAFNKMANNLSQSQAVLEEAKTSLEIKVAARTIELKELAQVLEDRVQERTQELQKRIEELEKFHRLTVGRELKMIELKKEIENAHKEVARLKSKMAKKIRRTESTGF